jgi:hypothetical protein
MILVLREDILKPIWNHISDKPDTADMQPMLIHLALYCKAR